MGYDAVKLYNRGGMVLSEITAEYVGKQPGADVSSPATHGILCAVPNSSMTSPAGLPAEGRIVIGGEFMGVHVYDLHAASSASSKRHVKALSSVEVGHDVALMRSGARFLCAASGIGE